MTECNNGLTDWVVLRSNGIPPSGKNEESKEGFGDTGLAVMKTEL